MKATVDFSFGDHSYKAGDAVNVTDETALEVLKKRGQVSEGKGKEAAPLEGESMLKDKVTTSTVSKEDTEKAELKTAKTYEKEFVAPQSKAVKNKVGKTLNKKR